MEQKNNAEYLKERLFYLGFAEKLNDKLDEFLKAKTEKFQIPFQADFSRKPASAEGDNVPTEKKIVDFVIDFSKSKKDDVWFINKYDATLKTEDPAKERTHTFYINKGNGVAAREAFNMLEGRAVYKKMFNKEGDPYHQWQEINFNKKDQHGNNELNTHHEKYGFNLEKALMRHPIKELSDPQRTAELIRSLEKGNRPQVTVQIDGKEHKMYLEAAVHDRRVNVFDEKGQKQFQGVREYKPENKNSQRETQSNGKEQSQGKDKTQKQEATADESDGPPRSRRKGMRV